MNNSQCGGCFHSNGSDLVTVEDNRSTSIAVLVYYYLSEDISSEFLWFEMFKLQLMYSRPLLGVCYESTIRL